MKKLLLCLLLVPLQVHASAVFFWRAEGTTLSATDDLSPDTSATANGGVSISNTAEKVGTNGILTTNQQDYYIFDPTGICSTTQGAFGGWIQFKTAVPAAGVQFLTRCFDASGAVSEVSLAMANSQEVRLTLVSSGGTSSFLVTSACNIAVDTWYFVVARYHIANDDRFIACYDSSGTLIDSVSDLTTDLAASAPSGLTEFRVGNPSANTNAIWADNIFVSQTYAEPLEDFHSITSFVPTYSAGPTNGTFTSTTLPFTYTPNQNGTTYAAACTNGQTVTTFANLKSGTCSGGAAVGTGTDASTATVSDTVTITGLVASTTYDVYIGHESSIGGQSAISSLADRATIGGGAPEFTVAPTATATTNGYIISGTITCTGTCTVLAVACAPGDAAPTSAEIETQDCGGGNAALISDAEVWTTGVSNNFSLTASSLPPRLDVYVSGTDGSTDTAVVSLPESDRAARVGFAIYELSTISATSIFDLDSYFTPDVAGGDVIEYEDDTNEDSDCNVSFEADGDFVLTPVGAGDCDGLRSFEISYEDVSSATTGLFTAPTVGVFSTDDTVYVNNNPPVCDIDAQAAVRLLSEDDAMASVDISAVGNCTDEDGHTLSASIDTGTLPVGTSLSGTGNLTWSGTPTTEDEGGEAITVEICDQAGDCTTFDFTVYTVNTWVVPDLDDLSASEAETAIIAAAPWRAFDAGLNIAGYVCGSGQDFLNVADQDPNAAAAAEPLEVIDISIVGAVIPDVSGMTLAEAIAAIEAVCP